VLARGASIEISLAGGRPAGQRVLALDLDRGTGACIWIWVTDCDEEGGSSVVVPVRSAVWIVMVSVLYGAYNTYNFRRYVYTHF
jgi:hypothetical protein